MKRLVITLEYPPQRGGIASYVYNFLLHSNPNEFILYAPRTIGDVAFDALQPWKTLRAEPYVRWWWPHWLRLFFQVRKIVQAEQITELYIHQALPVGYVGWLIKKLFKIPYTLFLHGTDVEMGTKKLLKRFNLRVITRNASKLVTNSQFLKSKILERLNTTVPTVVVYPCPGEQFFNVIPKETLDAHRHQLALDGKKVILSVARLVEGKGQIHLLGMLSEISRTIPNIVLLCIGDGPKRNELREFVQKNSLQNMVRFLGELPYEELPLYYQLSDVFVLLTHPDQDAEEGWGTVFLEAAASGLPVVAGRAGGTPEAVEHMRTGIVVDVYKEKVVVETIVELLKNTKFAHEMGEKGKERVQQEFIWEKQIAKL
jgi:phosphatidylinositol alpha-1,6-mannosyltransferase